MNAPAHNLPIGKLLKLDPFAVKQLADFGPGYFNPIIGDTEKKTFGNISDVMQFLHDLMGTDYRFMESLPGLRLLAQTAWVAAQYENFRRQPEALDTAEVAQ